MTPLAAATSSPEMGIVVNLPTGSISEGSDTPTGSAQAPTVSVTLIGPTTPADSWANTLLDRILPLFQSGLKPGDGFAWWQNNASSGYFNYADSQVTLGSAVFAPNSQQANIVAIPNPANTNQLSRVGLVDLASGTLVLTAFGTSPAESDVRWILTTTDPAVPFKSLAIQAAARSVRLVATYNENSDAGAELVLVGAEHFPAAATPTPKIGLSPATSPTLPPLPTATRAPDIVLGRLIALKLDPVIDGMSSVLPESTSAFASRHPLIGPLTWTETGPRISGMAMGIGQALELNIDYLAPGKSDGAVEPLLQAAYDGDITRLTDEHVYFQGQRMEEILYWIVYHSTDRKGVLVIAYDDFGARQTVTIVGFTLFSQIPK